MASIPFHSFMPYPLQKKLSEYYLKEEAESEKLSGKKEKKGVSLKSVSEPEVERPLRSELQRRSMENTKQIHAAMQGFIFSRSIASKRKRHEKMLQPDSPIKIYDTNAPYIEMLSNRTLILSTQDPVANECFKNLQVADRFYRGFCKVPPVVTDSEEMRGYIHDRGDYNGASWNGKEFHFGSFDPRVMKSTTDIDIVIHEVGHAIITFSSNLAYERQSGAINESGADVYAIIAKHLSAKTDANAQDADWDLAKVVVMDEEQYAPLRSFRNPGKAYKSHPILGDDTQVATMTEYVHEPSPSEENDWGGVHTYSGIPNHAFYLAATRLQGPTWGKIGRIWSEAITEAESDDDFATFAHRTIAAAKSLKYGEGVQSEIQKAWRDVGVIPSGKSCLSRCLARSKTVVEKVPVKKPTIVISAISATMLFYKLYYGIKLNYKDIF